MWKQVQPGLNTAAPLQHLAVIIRCFNKFKKLTIGPIISEMTRIEQGFVSLLLKQYDII